MCSVYALADLARQIGGDAVQVDWALEGGQSLDDYAPSMEIRQRFRRAEIVVSGGIGEDWALEGSDDAARARQVVRFDLLDSAAKPVRAGARQLWLDPDITCEALNAIADAYALQRPDQSNDFHERARQIAQQIQSVTREFAPRFESIKRQKVMVFSNDYSALTQRLGLVEIFAPGDSPLQVDDANVQAIRKIIRDQAPVALLIDANTSLAVQQSLSRRINLPLVGLESQGTSAGVGRNSYLTILRFNLEQLTALAAPKS